MSRDRRQAMFDDFAANLSLFVQDAQGRPPEGIFACPLCLRLFEDVDHLSLAHIRQESLGGTKVTLCCRDCNSHVGAHIESYLANWTKTHGALTGNGEVPIKATMLIPGVGKQVVELFVRDEGDHKSFDMRVIAQASNPAEVEAISGQFRNNWDGLQFDVNVQAKAGWDVAKLAYVHAAYLELFHRFGYEWVFSGAAGDLRKQLLEPKAEHVQSVVNWLPRGKVPHIAPDEMAVCVVKAPIECLGFLVVFPEEPVVGGDRPIVWLPGLAEEYVVPELMRSEYATNLTMEPPRHDEFTFRMFDAPRTMLRGLFAWIRSRAGTS